MEITNDEKISLSVAVWLLRDTYEHNNDPNHISATGLLNSPRQIVLAKRAATLEVDPITKVEPTRDISMNIPSSMGTALHDSIERAWLDPDNVRQALIKLGVPESSARRIIVNPPKGVDLTGKIPVYMEIRTIKAINGWNVGGKFDFVMKGKLEDFKSTGTYGFMKGNNDEKFKVQGSIYRWLNPEIITNTHMSIQYLFTDWSKLQSMVQEKKGYPQSRNVTKTIPLMSIEETESWISNKLMTIDSLKNTKEVDIPLCTPEDLWQDASEFKYYKNPNTDRKRSTKNFKTFYDANARLIADGAVGIVVEVKGKVKKCKYCNAAIICTQKDTYIASGLLAL